MPSRGGSAFSRGSTCRRVCRQSCRRDGVCRDGGRGAVNGDRPECNYGEDCADCGRRALCTPVGTSMTLPYDALRHGTRRPLMLSHILFAVMGSMRFRARSALTHQSWCQQQKASCLFFADGRAETVLSGAEAAGGDTTRSIQQEVGNSQESMPVVRVHGARPPARCFCNESIVTERFKWRLNSSSGFFCRSHRAATLEAQYRFLPALGHIKSSNGFKNGNFLWIVMVDDDSFVFSSRLRAQAQAPRLVCSWAGAAKCRGPIRTAACASGGLLSLLDEELPVYLGDFVSSPEAFKRSGVQDFACGGGGSVLSASALRRMDIDNCIDDYHRRCMQSDWMIGGCAARHNVSFIRTLGCSTCDRKRADALAASGRLQASFNNAQCFFAQNFPSGVQPGTRAPAIVHGFSDAERHRFFSTFSAGAARREIVLQRARDAAREVRDSSGAPPPPPHNTEANASVTVEETAAAARETTTVIGEMEGAVDSGAQVTVPHVAPAQWGQLPRAVQLMLGRGAFVTAAIDGTEHR